MTTPRMTRQRMEILLTAVCLLEVHYEDEYEHDYDEQNRAKAELDLACRVLLNKWGHLLDDEKPNDTARKVRGLP